jgi:hypothetical protein
MKEKNEKFDFIKSKYICFLKDNVKNPETRHKWGENTCKAHI